ncbi:ABC transporter permease [Georgenia alba]|uniref:ABC transporter permease n=1 Tax=Georgenia alba TaxID=2233858 RepID=A0ABW2Q6P0_9MICO
MGDLLAAARRTAAPYRAVLASRVRSQRSYRANFRLDLVGALVVGLTEMTEVFVLYTAVDGVGGFTLAQIVLVFGLADMCFSFADMVFGHVDGLAVLVRQGKLDIFYLRPQPLLAQLVTSDIQLRRLARAVVGCVAFAVGLVINDIDWGVGAVVLLLLAVLSGIATFSAQFVLAAGMQFYLLNAKEVTNAFVYGGRYASSQPATVWSRWIVVAFGFVFPMAFTAYLPVTALLGLPGAAWLPSWLGWCTPVAAAWSWGLALLFWRAGVRHYQGGGG